MYHQQTYQALYVVNSIKQAIYSDICYLLSFSSTSLVQITVVSLVNLHKRPKALACYYVTSYWQAEWVKKLRWKTIELPSPLLLRAFR